MNITHTINKCYTAHQKLQEQAGGRMIVSFIIANDDGTTRMRYTSHFGTVDEVLKEWDRYIERYGDNVTIESAHSDAILAEINK